MKATGVVRRIDDLGRVVIPKEIRKDIKFILVNSYSEIYKKIFKKGHHGKER